MKKSVWIGIIIFIVGFLVYSSSLGEKKIVLGEKENVVLKTQDNVNLKGSYYPRESSKAVILLHMLNSDRKSYDEFASLLNENYGVLSIDSRGHGESDLNWKDFSESDFNKMVLDVKSAKGFLLEKGFDEIYIVGASIGANIALNYAVTDNTIKKIVLLSSGLNYRGVSTEESIKNYSGKVLIVASEEDKYAFSSSEKLYEEAKGEKEFVRLNGAGHGASMFKGTNLMREVIDWFGKT